MKRCPNCGCSLNDNAISCSQCGATISKKSSTQAGNVKAEITERAIKGRKESKLLLIPAFIFLIWITSVILGVVLNGGIKTVFILLAVLLIVVFFVSTIPLSTKMKRENTIAKVTYAYLEKQNKLDLLDTLTNEHIIMVSPLVFSNGKIIACPSQGVAIPIENIEKIEGIDGDGASKRLLVLLLFGLILSAVLEKSAGMSYYGIKIFTKDKRCFCIELDKHEFAQLIKKNPEILPGNIELTDIF